MSINNDRQPESILHLSKEGTNVGEFHGDLEDFLTFALKQALKHSLMVCMSHAKRSIRYSTRRAMSMGNKKSITPQPPLPHQEISAFCQTCPPPHEVTNVLVLLGFSLTFQMQADSQQAYLQLKPLPAQMHYEGPYGMNVVYLAGEDLNIDDECIFPAHASRFWLYPGNESEPLFQHVIDVLSNAFSLSC